MLYNPSPPGSIVVHRGTLGMKMLTALKATIFHSRTVVLCAPVATLPTDSGKQNARCIRKHKGAFFARKTSFPGTHKNANNLEMYSLDIHIRSTLIYVVKDVYKLSAVRGDFWQHLCAMEKNTPTHSHRWLEPKNGNLGITISRPRRRSQFVHVTSDRFLQRSQTRRQRSKELWQRFLCREELRFFTEERKEILEYWFKLVTCQHQDYRSRLQTTFQTRLQETNAIPNNRMSSIAL